MIDSRFGFRWRDGLFRRAAGAYVDVLRCTTRVQRIGDAIVDRLHRMGHSAILVCWRSQWLTSLWLLEHQGIYALSGRGRQEYMYLKLFDRLGWRVIPGAYPSRAILEMRHQLDLGNDVALISDGPGGPLRQVQPGPLFLAEKSGHPIVPIAVAARPVLTRRNDGTLLPVPLGRVILCYGTPVWVEKGWNPAEFNRKKTELEQALCEAEAGARLGLDW